MQRRGLIGKKWIHLKCGDEMEESYVDTQDSWTARKMKSGSQDKWWRQNDTNELYYPGYITRGRCFGKESEAGKNTRGRTKGRPTGRSTGSTKDVLGVNVKDLSRAVEGWGHRGCHSFPGSPGVVAHSMVHTSEQVTKARLFRAPAKVLVESLRKWNLSSCSRF